MNKKSTSKIYAIGIGIVTVLLTAFAIHRNMEGTASAIYSTGITASVALYANKQYQLRKEKELDNNK